MLQGSPMSRQWSARSGLVAMGEPVLAEVLEEVIYQHDRAGSPLRASLRFGYQGDVDSVFEDGSLAIHPSIVQLFRWHDGIDWDAWRGSGVPSLFPYYGEFHPFESQLKSRFVMLDSLDGGRESSFWRYSWFPALGGTTSLAVECDPSSSEYGSVWLSSVDATRAEPVAESLHSVFETVAELFENRRFDYTVGGISTSPEVGSDVVLSWLRGAEGG